MSGHYFAREVGWLVGVSGRTIGQWNRRGYIRASRRASSYPNIYTFQDVAEAMVVHELIARGTQSTAIKQTLDELRKSHGYDWALTYTDTGIIGDLLRNLRNGGWAAREHNLRHIELDSDRLSGRPAIRGTRVPALMAGRMAQTAEGCRILESDYGLTQKQVSDARVYWSTVQTYETAA